MEGMEMRKIAGALCTLLLIAAVPVSGSGTELPLGMPGLPETRSSEVLAPGVTYTRIDRGFPSDIDHWTVDGHPIGRTEAGRRRGDRGRPRVGRLRRADS